MNEVTTKLPAAIEAAMSAYSNSSFECGEYDRAEDDEPYSTYHDASERAAEALRQAIAAELAKVTRVVVTMEGGNIQTVEADRPEAVTVTLVEVDPEDPDNGYQHYYELPGDHAGEIDSAIVGTLPVLPLPPDSERWLKAERQRAEGGV